MVQGGQRAQRDSKRAARARWRYDAELTFTSPETVLALINTESLLDSPGVPSSGIVDDSRPEMDVASTSTSSPRATVTATLPETVRTEMSDGTSTESRTLPDAVRIFVVAPAPAHRTSPDAL